MKQPETRVSSLPAFVQIEPVGQCNLRCRMCSVRFRTDGPVDGQPAFMKTGVFKKLVDQLTGAATELHLQGLGEPLMHPSFFQMVSYAARRGFRVTTNSNMSILDRKRAEECVRSGLSWIRISIDGSTAETYESIRVGARFNRVLGNIRMLIAAKERLRSVTPRLFLVTVVVRRNVHELKDIVRLAHRFSMEQVFVQHLCHDFMEEDLPVQYASMREFVETETLLHEDPSRIENYFEEVRSAAGELNMELRLPGLQIRGHPAWLSGRERCDWPWRSAYISYDGRAIPCCMIGTPDRINFGNMAQQGVARVWNNEAYQQFRSRLDSSEPPSICRSCSIYQGTF